jgi:hypothetical protein
MAEKNTETKIPVVIPVDAERLSQGLRMTFEGMSMVFDSIGAGCRISEEAEEEHDADAKSDVSMKRGVDTKSGAGMKDALSRSAEKAAAEASEQTDEKDKGTGKTAAEPEPQKMEKQAQDTPAEIASTQTAPAKKEAAPEALSVTIDDITKIIVQKIKKDRGNNVKIGAILKTYGVAKVSELPSEKYEAFLTELAAL